MPQRPHLPDALRGRVFTAAQAHDAGLSKRQLSGRHVVSVRFGHYRYRDDELGLSAHLRAIAAELPPDAALSHLTALRMFGVDLGPVFPVHFSTTTDAQTRHADVTLHRRNHRLTPIVIDDLPCLGPDRSFVDAATLLGARDLVRAGDALVRQQHTTLDRLITYTINSHIDGVLRARDAVVLVREAVDSFRETDVRLIISLAGLPEPRCNMNIFDGETFLARGDLTIPEFKVVVEYDGWHHDRDAAQRQKDLYRRERLEAAGWIVVVITSADLKHPTSIVARVFETLVRRGYTGPPPELGHRWHRIVRGL